MIQTQIYIERARMRAVLMSFDANWFDLLRRLDDMDRRRRELERVIERCKKVLAEFHRERAS